MDTTTPPPPPPTPPAPSSTQVARWRRPLADLVDLVVLGLAAAGVGAAVAGLLLLDTGGDDPWAGLAAVLLGLGAAGVTALVVWIVLLVRVHTGRTTPGHRLAGCPVDRSALATAGSHVALVVAGWGLVVTLAGLTEPPPDGLVGGALGAALVAVALVISHGWGMASTRVAIVAGALVLGGVVAGAVPDRAPYSWELRDVAHAAMVAELERDPSAVRDCVQPGTAGTPQSSRASDPCARPDRVWRVQRSPALVADALAGSARRVVDRAVVAVDQGADGLAVTLDGDAVVIVSALDARCGSSRVVLDRYDVRPDAGRAPLCR